MCVLRAACSTININATCGGEDDWYYYSPWRAPGAAPVMDSCGVAGGHQPPQGYFGGIYVNTSHAHIGDYGTQVLPKMPSGVEWKAGVDYEVTWTIEANHAGGCTLPHPHTPSHTRGESSHTNRRMP